MFVGVGSSFAEPLQIHSFELGPEISHITYEEPGVMEEKGIMYGISGSYTYHNNLMLKAEGKGSWGEVDYDGRTQDGTPLTIDNIDDYILEFRGLVGYDFPALKASILTPYIGFGYRYLNDDISFHPAGYERESNYYYSPIGLAVITDLENGWSIGTMFEYDYFWKGEQVSHSTDLGCSNDLENEQEDGYGLRGSVKLQKKSKGMGFSIEPFIRYWDIDDSDIALTSCQGFIFAGMEPENNSTEIGVKIAVVF